LDRCLGTCRTAELGLPAAAFITVCNLNSQYPLYCSWLLHLSGATLLASESCITITHPATAATHRPPPSRPSRTSKAARAPPTELRVIARYPIAARC